jgi:hypothetical protein
MKLATFILLIIFLFAQSKASAQNWPIEKQHFDSLYTTGKYLVSVVPGKQIYSILENTKISEMILF